MRTQKQKPKTIYLDIDGVLLANEKNLAYHAEKLIHTLVQNYHVKWLTTHCMNGDPNQAIKVLSEHCTEYTSSLLQLIQPTTWQTAKTEAIDFSEPFLWLDDDLYPDEQRVLQQHNSTECWVEINLAKNPNQLQEVLNELKSNNKNKLFKYFGF